MYSFFDSGFRFESSFSCLLGHGESVLGTITGVPVRILSGVLDLGYITCSKQSSTKSLSGTLQKN